MNVLSYESIKSVELTTCNVLNINHLVLINRAADVFTDWFLSHFKDLTRPVFIVCGPGNNGADGMEMAKRLATAGYEITIGLTKFYDQYSPENEQIRHTLYASMEIVEIDPKNLDQLKLNDEWIIIDGLLGSGLSRPVESHYARLINKINESSSLKISIDIPSGLHADIGVIGPAIIADHTIGLGICKLGYFLNEETDFTGQLTMLDIGLIQPETPSGISYTEKNEISQLIKKPCRIVHKYNRGHSLIAGGSYGMAGCVRLAGLAALRAGCGVVTLHVPGKSVDFLQASFPEAMIDVDENDYNIGELHLDKRYDAIGIGIGMGTHVKQESLISQVLDADLKTPLVLDADALNILGKNTKWLNKLPAGSILTPHPGEFKRLFGETKSAFERLEILRNKAVEHKCFIILKGADTFIATPDKKLFINSTGNCGMATAGSGDVLTGILTSLISQGYSSQESCVIGVYLHGLAGDLAARKHGFLSLMATDIIENIGNAYQQLQ